MKRNNKTYAQAIAAKPRINISLSNTATNGSAGGDINAVMRIRKLAWPIHLSTGSITKSRDDTQAEIAHRMTGLMFEYVQLVGIHSSFLWIVEARREI